MMERFLDSWALFHNSWLAGMFMAATLGCAGVLVTARSRLFVGAAVAQASTFGVALGLWLGFEGDTALSLLAVALGVLAALAADWFGQRGGEMLNAWVFLGASSCSVLLMANSPHGMEELQRMISSSLIGATGQDALILGILAVVTVAACFANRDRLILHAIDPAMAAAVGMNPRRWTTVNGVALGLMLGLSIKVAGMLFAFGLLVLPAMAARRVSREIRPLFWTAPLIAVVATAAGLALAEFYDFPPAQVTVALLAALSALSALR